MREALPGVGAPLPPSYYLSKHPRHLPLILTHHPFSYQCPLAALLCTSQFVPGVTYVLVCAGQLQFTYISLKELSVAPLFKCTSLDIKLYDALTMLSFNCKA